MGDEGESRRLRGRPAMPVGKIVTTALQLLDEDGVDALTMRTLAVRLESGTATLYRHFSNRAALVTRVVDEVFGEAVVDAGESAGQDWRQGCKTLARNMFDVLRRHPNVAPLLTGATATGRNAVMLRERLIALMLAGGFPPEHAARAYATLARYVLGFALQAADHSDGELSDAIRQLDPQRFPATHAVAGHLPVPLEEEFVFGLDLIIGGLAQELRRR